MDFVDHKRSLFGALTLNAERHGASGAPNGG